MLSIYSYFKINVPSDFAGITNGVSSTVRSIMINGAAASVIPVLVLAVVGPSLALVIQRYLTQAHISFIVTSFSVEL